MARRPGVGIDREGRGYPRIQIVMTDLDVLERCRKVTGKGNITGPHKVRSDKHTPTHAWTVGTSKDACDLMTAVLPLMGKRRSARIREILDEYEEARDVAKRYGISIQPNPLPQEKSLMATRTTTDQIAWAAGLFEGEGCISIRNEGGREYVRLNMGMTDEDVVRRFHSIVRCGHIHRSSKGAKPMFVWQCQRTLEAQDLLRAMMPWFGKRRKEKAQQALAVELVFGYRGARRTHCKRGHAFTTSNTYTGSDGRRRCRACRNTRTSRKEK